ncbi:MAG: excisionase family DNA-binding protein [Bauldia sp.]|nr:excisionase family DNA-binding protein [Bauldia sp.]
MAARTHVFDDRMPSDVEIESANRLRMILADEIMPDEPTRFRLVAERGRQADVVLAPGVAKALLDLLQHVGSGRAVTLVPKRHMLTTQQAADLLNVSRPHLIKLLDQGKMKYETVGRHRRISAEAALDYRTERDADRAAALAELAAIDADLV